MNLLNYARITGRRKCPCWSSYFISLGQTALAGKIAETKQAIEDGADEIDYIINVGKAKMHGGIILKKRCSIAQQFVINMMFFIK